MMNVNIAKQSLAQAHLSLIITHSTDPEKEKQLRKLEGMMENIINTFEELVE